MAFESLIENLKSSATTLWSRIEESSAFNQLKDKYENMSPVAQKSFVYASIFIALFLVFSFPLGYLSISRENLESFLQKRSLIQELFRSKNEIQEIPFFTMSPQSSTLQSLIDSKIKSLPVLPEQVGNIEFMNEKSELVSTALNAGLIRVPLNKLNLNEIVNLGYLLQNIHPSTKLKDLSIQANTQDPRYFDVIFEILIFSVPDFSEPPPPLPEERPKKK